MSLLSAPFGKFSADAEKVVYLLEVPRYFDLTLYSSGRLEKVREPCACPLPFARPGLRCGAGLAFSP